MTSVQFDQLLVLIREALIAAEVLGVIVTGVYAASVIGRA